MAGRARRLTRPADLRKALGIPSDYGLRRRLPRHREASRLVGVGRNPDRQPGRLAPRAAIAWSRMRAAAQQDRIILVPLSGYRSASRQAAIIRRKLAAGQKLAEVLKWIAAPGYSQHHTGRAIDIGAPGKAALAQDFGRTRQGRWLRRRAHEFGFVMTYPRKNSHGIGYEPWHWYWLATG